MNQPAKTIKRLAQEWNTTYLRLVQACQEMEVPRPSQGHWQLVARGKTIEKEPVEFHMREAMKRHDHSFTAEEREAPGFSWRYKYDWVGSGSLRFQIHGGECVHERAWEDSRKSKLEDQVEDIVETLANIEEEAKQIRAAREERKKQQEEEWRRREEQRRKQEQIQKDAEHRRRIEEENRKRLEEKAQAWREARILRRFVHACEAVLRKKGKPFPANGWEGRWLVWAREHADRLDPMTSGFLEAEERRLTAPEQDGNGSKLEDMSLGAKMQGMMFGENFP